MMSTNKHRKDSHPWSWGFVGKRKEYAPIEVKFKEGYTKRARTIDPIKRLKVNKETCYNCNHFKHTAFGLFCSINGHNLDCICVCPKEVNNG